MRFAHLGWRHSGLYNGHMYEFIRGKIHSMLPGTVILDANGVGYRVQVPLSTSGKLKGAEALLLVHHTINAEQGEEKLFGFLTDRDEPPDRPLIAVVEDTLSVDPELRPRSAAAFARQLSPFISPVANSESETNQRFAPSYSPSNALSKVPQPHRDSACPGDLLLAPTFPRSPPAPRLEALQGDACAHISQADSSGRPSLRARRIGWFVGVSFGLGLILAALDALS